MLHYQQSNRLNACIATGFQCFPYVNYIHSCQRNAYTESAYGSNFVRRRMNMHQNIELALKKSKFYERGQPSIPQGLGANATILRFPRTEILARRLIRFDRWQHLTMPCHCGITLSDCRRVYVVLSLPPVLCILQRIMWTFRLSSNTSNGLGGSAHTRVA